MKSNNLPEKNTFALKSTNFILLNLIKEKKYAEVKTLLAESDSHSIKLAQREDEKTAQIIIPEFWLLVDSVDKNPENLELVVELARLIGQRPVEEVCKNALWYVLAEVPNKLFQKGVFSVHDESEKQLLQIFNWLHYDPRRYLSQTLNSFKCRKLNTIDHKLFLLGCVSANTCINFEDCLDFYVNEGSAGHVWMKSRVCMLEELHYHNHNPFLAGFFKVFSQKLQSCKAFELIKKGELSKNLAAELNYQILERLLNACITLDTLGLRVSNFMHYMSKYELGRIPRKSFWQEYINCLTAQEYRSNKTQLMLCILGGDFVAASNLLSQEDNIQLSFFQEQNTHPLGICLELYAVLSLLSCEGRLESTAEQKNLLYALVAKIGQLNAPDVFDINFNFLLEQDNCTYEALILVFDVISAYRNNNQLGTSNIFHTSLFYFVCRWGEQSFLVGTDSERSALASLLPILRSVDLDKLENIFDSDFNSNDKKPMTQKKLLLGETLFTLIIEKRFMLDITTELCSFFDEQLLKQKYGDKEYLKKFEKSLMNALSEGKAFGFTSFLKKTCGQLPSYRQMSHITPLAFALYLTIEKLNNREAEADKTQREELVLTALLKILITGKDLKNAIKNGELQKFQRELMGEWRITTIIQFFQSNKITVSLAEQFYQHALSAELTQQKNFINHAAW